MSNTLETIKNLAARFAPPAVLRRLNFMPTLISGGGSYGVSAAGNLSMNHGFSSTSGAGDTEYLDGDVLDNSVVAACVNAITQALPEAPILLEKRVNGVEFERVEAHPVLDLLRNPNPYLSEAELWGITTAFERTRGEAFWYFEYDESGSVPREIWFRAPQYVQTLSDAEHFISGYNIMAESGKMVALGEGEVVHFRHQLSARNPRAGWSPIQTGRRQIVGDNSASVYHSAILRNAGAASLIISLKDAAAAGEVTPGQLDEYVQQFKRKSSGNGAGAILGMDLPLDVHKVGFSPDEMALDKLLAHYESRICALLGVNRRVINLGQDPTYENSRVALKDFWSRTIIPMRRRHAATLSSQILPLFGLDPSQYRLSFDFSHVEALREDVDALHARWRATFLAGGIDLYTFQERIGLAPDEAYRGRYAKPSSALDTGEGGDEIKAVWNEADHPRATDGRFGHVAGSPRALPVQKVSGTSGSASSSSGGTAGAARSKLHREHGVGKVEQETTHGADSGRKVPLVLGMNRFDVTKLADNTLRHMKSQGYSAKTARKLLVRMHKTPDYKEQKKKVRNLEKELKDMKLKENSSLSKGRLNLDLTIAVEAKKYELEHEKLALRNMYRKRFPQMWEILCANDSAVFNASEFAIYRTEFTEAENGDINRGIDFFARMISGHEFAPTGDLKFKKSSEERSGYFADGSGNLPKNTIAIGTESESARPDVIAHEMAHWLIEKNPQLQQQLKWHFDRRTQGEPALKLNESGEGIEYEDHEEFKRDRFIEPYMGKFYADGQNEILTVGLQYFIVAPDVLAKKDPETFDFIYKLMRGETPEPEPMPNRRHLNQNKTSNSRTNNRGINHD